MSDEGAIVIYGCFEAPEETVFIRQPRITVECQHSQFIVTASSNTVRCAKCKEDLNPIWVLDQMAKKESRVRNRLDALTRAVEKASAKTKVKCDHCDKFTRLVK